MSSFNGLYKNLLQNGSITTQKGRKILELENALCHFYPYERFASYPSRGLNINYVKDELMWNLRGDSANTSIFDRAKKYDECHGQINLDYGRTIFKDGQIDYAVYCLARDVESKNAAINLIGNKHIFRDNKVVPSTAYIGFKVKDKKLNCSVTLRSTNALYGLTTDIPFFSFVQECVFTYLRNQLFSQLTEMGKLILFSGSLYCYEEHIPMLRMMANESPSYVHCPKIIDEQEVDDLRSCLTAKSKPLMPFSQWLIAKDPIIRRMPYEAIA